MSVDRRKMRLAGIAAREVWRDRKVDAGCRQGHSRPSADGIPSRRALTVGDIQGLAPKGHLLVRSKAFHCVSNGSGSGDG
jgi:hypothetical protein